MSKNAPLLEIKDLSKTYPSGITALENTNFSLRRGEFFSLLGPSGCGKSTLLRLIAGLDQPTHGSIAWSGTASARHEISYVFQEPTLLPWANIFDNVYLPFRLRHIPRDEVKEKIDAMLERVGLGDFTGAMPRDLSAGMKMRVSIARALVTSPQLLLMDEPFAALDEISRFRLNDDLLELWRLSKTTIVFVTHSVFESVYLSQRIGIMTPHPGCIGHLVDVPVFKNTGQKLRTCAEYNAICSQVSQKFESTAA